MRPNAGRAILGGFVGILAIMAPCLARLRVTLVKCISRERPKIEMQAQRRDRLCSGIPRCVAPVFSAVYERSSRLAPSLALMLAAPSLNPAALVLTFLLFSPKIAAARLLMSAVAVLSGGFLIERFMGDVALAPIHGNSQQQPRLAFAGPYEVSRTFFRSLGYILLRTLPALVVGVILSMLFTEYLPSGLLASSRLHPVYKVRWHF